MGFELTINLPLDAVGVMPSEGSRMIFQWFMTIARRNCRAIA